MVATQVVRSLRVIRDVLGEPRQRGGVRIGGEDGMDIGGCLRRLKFGSALEVKARGGIQVQRKTELRELRETFR
jgi:hypothetical protein